MKLRQVSITGYRSIRERLDFALDDRVTVVLGANDHGKTNVLQAITHLNQDRPFEAERDLNWDYHDRGNEFPRIDYKLVLSDSERASLLDVENAAIRRLTIREFRESIEEASREANSAWAEAKGEVDQASAALAELEAQAPVEEPAAVPASPAEPVEAEPKNAAAVPAARSEVTLRTRLAEEAAERVALTESRVALATAEEMQVEADLNGQRKLDIPAIAVEAVAVATRAATNAKAAQTRSDTAESARTQAAATHAAGSEELTKAEQDAATAASRASAAAIAAEEAEREAARLTVIADALKFAADGGLAFDKDASLPEANLLDLAKMPTEVVLSRAGVEGKLVLVELSDLDHGALAGFILPRLPRVELISPQDSLSDIATAGTIEATENDFMRGIFRYARSGSR